MQIHPFISADLPLLTLLQPEGWPDIVPVHTFYVTSSFCFPVKLTIANELVGVGTTIMHNDVAWLAHIIVHPDYRNRGLGKVITKALIDAVDPRVCKTIYLIATTLGEPVYEKLGFVTETEYLFYKDIIPADNYYPSINIIPYNTTFHDQIQRIDQIVSGENRLFHFEEQLSNSYVYVTNGIVEGYYIPNFHEGLIASVSEKSGIELMAKRFTTKVNAVFPIDNITAISYMRIQGFEPFKTAKRMRLGEIRTVAYSNIYNRIAGSIG
jgi:GNAT superfamily N-acetyltransferase